MREVLWMSRFVCFYLVLRSDLTLYVNRCCMWMLDVAVTLVSGQCRKLESFHCHNPPPVGTCCHHLHEYSREDSAERLEQHSVIGLLN